jgi:RNA polymerase sigma-70 factor (ECF subfamily)
MVTHADEELMMQFQAGNVYAYELLCERYRTRTFAFIYRLLGGDREPAEDLLQDIFVKIAGAARLYEPRAKFSTWLFTIARNHCRNYLKSRPYLQQQVTVSADIPAPPGVDAGVLVDTTDNPAQNVQNRETAEILEAAIRRLPDAEREVFVLRAVEGFSHEESARILGLNPATVRTHYHRARQHLKADIGPVLDPTSSTPENRRPA